MGQLDPVEINETFLSGFLCSIAVGYVALGIESIIESLKMYIISSVSLVTGKTKKFYIRTTTAEFPGRAQNKSWAVYNPGKVVHITRPIDDIIIWAAEAKESEAQKLLKRTLSRFG
jgi:hypothetical protein